MGPQGFEGTEGAETLTETGRKRLGRLQYPFIIF
jgi:hypothetical protein